MPTSSTLAVQSPQPLARREPGLAGLIRRHPLAAFLTWSFSVGQLLAFTPLAVDTGLPRQLFVVASTLFGLLLPAVVITRIVDGPAGVRALWQGAVRGRVPWGWYALALVAVPAVATAIAAAFLGRPPDLSSSAVVSAAVGGLLLSFLLTFVVNNWWEEVAWMGFVQARLQTRRRPLWAAVLTAPLFAMQHVSLTAGNPPVVMVLMMLVLIVLSVPFRIFNGWVYNRTGSLFIVGLAHGASNAVSGGSGFQDGFLARLYPDEPLAVMSHQLAFVVLGLVVLVATRGRLGAARPTSITHRRTDVALPPTR